jgi:hypothetical protein
MPLPSAALLEECIRLLAEAALPEAVIRSRAITILRLVALMAVITLPRVAAAIAAADSPAHAVVVHTPLLGAAAGDTRRHAAAAVAAVVALAPEVVVLAAAEAAVKASSCTHRCYTFIPAASALGAAGASRRKK